MYSPKAKKILLNNPRDKIEGIIPQYSLSLRLVIVFLRAFESCCKFALFFVIILSKLFDYSYRDKLHSPLEFNRFIYFNQQKLDIFILKTVKPNLDFTSIPFVTSSVA